MAHVNIEIKAQCPDPERIRRVLNEHMAEFRGIDEQTDTYFKVPRGRLKLRQGNIENSLIFYQRPDDSGPKRADVSLFTSNAPATAQLYNVLVAALDVLVVVKKRREIYFLENVKFHLDLIRNLGTFVEIEAIDERGCIGVEKLRQQCDYYMHLFGIDAADLIKHSYSDLLMERNSDDKP